MPLKIRKLPNKDLYRVYNTVTKEIHSNATTLKKAKAQVRLLMSKEKKGGAINPHQEEYEKKRKEYEDYHPEFGDEIEEEPINYNEINTLGREYHQEKQRRINEVNNILVPQYYNYVNDVTERLIEEKIYPNELIAHWRNDVTDREFLQENVDKYIKGHLSKNQIYNFFGNLIKSAEQLKNYI